MIAAVPQTKKRLKYFLFCLCVFFLLKKYDLIYDENMRKRYDCSRSLDEETIRNRHWARPLSVLMIAFTQLYSYISYLYLIYSHIYTCIIFHIMFIIFHISLGDTTVCADDCIHTVIIIFHIYISHFLIFIHWTFTMSKTFMA